MVVARGGEDRVQFVLVAVGVVDAVVGGALRWGGEDGRFWRGEGLRVAVCEGLAAAAHVEVGGGDAGEDVGSGGELVGRVVDRVGLDFVRGLRAVDYVGVASVEALFDGFAVGNRRRGRKGGLSARRCLRTLSAGDVNDGRFALPRI